MESPAQRLIIVPAAGFGRRLGSPVAKELLPRPEGATFPGRPMIDIALEVARTANTDLHVITRTEKAPLSEYLRQQTDVSIAIQEVGVTREWPETLLLSAPYWRDYNLVVLPDVDFAPLAITQQMFKSLQRGRDELCFATFQAKDYSQWGVVDGAAGLHCEKPTEVTETTRAWGLFGFCRSQGQAILQQMLDCTFDHRWRSLPGYVSLFELAYFRDLTRGGE